MFYIVEYTLTNVVRAGRGHVFDDVQLASFIQ